jgi:hypothetical protein
MGEGRKEGRLFGDGEGCPLRALPPISPRLKEPQETLIPDTVLKGSADLAGVKEGGLL